MAAQKYKLTNETKIVGGVKVRRIKYLRDVRHDLMGIVAAKGSKGGFLQSEANLNQHDSSIVMGTAVVLGNARVMGWGTQVCGRAIVGDDARICRNAFVGDDAKIGGRVRIIDGMYYGKIEVTGRTRLEDCDMQGDLRIYGGRYVKNGVYDHLRNVREIKRDKRRRSKGATPSSG